MEHLIASLILVACKNEAQAFATDYFDAAEATDFESEELFATAQYWCKASDSIVSELQRSPG